MKPSSRLLAHAEQWLIERKVKYLQVKTVAHTSKSAEYAQTREFYLAKGQILSRSTPKAKLVKLSPARRRAAERQLTRECEQARQVFNTKSRPATGAMHRTSAPRGRPSRNGQGLPSAPGPRNGKTAQIEQKA